MNKILEIIANKLHWIVLILVEMLALSFVFNTGLYHRFINTSLSNDFVASVNEISGTVQTYLSLRETNELLMAQNALLEARFLALNRMIEQAAADTVRPLILKVDSLHPPIEFTFQSASVILLSINRVNNVMTIDKGRLDGIRTDCGVVSPCGVVGVVSAVSDHYATVVPLTNAKMKLSCKIQGSEYFGNLSWQDPGNNVAFLTDLPRHAVYNAGDSVLTSGFSSIFPPNLLVGVVDTIRGRNSFQNANKIPVRFATDFGNVRNVYVITHSSYLPKPSELPLGDKEEQE